MAAALIQLRWVWERPLPWYSSVVCHWSPSGSYSLVLVSYLAGPRWAFDTVNNHFLLSSLWHGDLGQRLCSLCLILGSGHSFSGSWQVETSTYQGYVKNWHLDPASYCTSYSLEWLLKLLLCNPTVSAWVPACLCDMSTWTRPQQVQLNLFECELLNSLVFSHLN